MGSWRRRTRSPGAGPIGPGERDAAAPPPLAWKSALQPGPPSQDSGRRRLAGADRLLSAAGPPQRRASPGHLGLPPVSTPKSQVTGQEVHGVLPDGEPRPRDAAASVLTSSRAAPLHTGLVSAWEAEAVFLPFLGSEGT